ncbi:GAF and ANTAR domain-containing protein [Streptomyces sp. NPDC006367]|uniref:GAF and ANTAR domain-containing protein n=1 Tax=unclassified Streptomyces TaxID=2593676 RepID=UPI0033A9CE1D
MRPSDGSRWPPDGGGAAGAIADGVRGTPPAQVPARLCAIAVGLLPVTGASASLRGGDGHPVRLCASGDRASCLAEIQATLGDGPCVHAAETGTPVLVRDLRSGADACRWPVFAQQATAVGVRAVYAVPLGDDGVSVGTLDLYRDTPGGLTRDQLDTARLLAGAMTAALTALPRDEEYGTGGGEESWLSGLAGDHDEVHRAVGMIMAQLGVGADEALARLRADAFARDRTAHAAARDVLAHRRRFGGDG